jgi:hypothetical protein
MRENSVRSNGENAADDVANTDDAVNARLVEILKANAVRQGGAEEVDDMMPKRGFFAETYAIASLLGLMVVAYVYGLLVRKNA